MSQARLMLYVHREVTDSLDLIQVANDFVFLVHLNQVICRQIELSSFMIDNCSCLCISRDVSFSKKKVRFQGSKL